MRGQRAPLTGQLCARLHHVGGDWGLRRRWCAVRADRATPLWSFAAHRDIPSAPTGGNDAGARWCEVVRTPGSRRVGVAAQDANSSSGMVITQCVSRRGLR